MIEFAFSQQQRAYIFFISSVSVVGRSGNLPNAPAIVPEVVLEDWRTAKMGYGQSKLVSERLLADASRNGVSTTICRVGQVAGPVLRGSKGLWPEQEWLPSIVGSRKSLRKVPETLGHFTEVAWVPVDLVAHIITELLCTPASDDQSRPLVYHIVNPQTCSWKDLLPTVMKSLHTDDILTPISFSAWVDALGEETSRRKSPSETFADIPAAKLRTFLNDLKNKDGRSPEAMFGALDTRVIVRYSKTLQRLGQVEPEWMRLWIKQWHAAK